MHVFSLGLLQCMHPCQKLVRFCLKGLPGFMWIVHRLRFLGCHFMVAGRWDKEAGKFMTLRDLQVGRSGAEACAGVHAVVLLAHVL